MSGPDSQGALISSQGFPPFSFHQYENVSPFIAYYRSLHYWTIPCSMSFLCSVLILLISEEVTALFYLYEEDGLWNQISWAGASLPTSVSCMTMDKTFNIFVSHLPHNRQDFEGRDLSLGSPGCPETYSFPISASWVLTSQTLAVTPWKIQLLKVKQSLFNRINIQSCWKITEI